MIPIYQESDDSYLLSEAIINRMAFLLNKNPDLRVLEIGCGSGIILKTLVNAGIKKENILACDINPAAVEHCKKLGFNCIQSDLFSNIKGKFDLIIFNPPYLPEDKREPSDSKISTTGGEKGSEIINKFIKKSKKHLNKNGKIFLLTSSLSKSIDWGPYARKILVSKKIFFEELFVWELMLEFS